MQTTVFMLARNPLPQGARLAHKFAGATMLLLIPFQCLCVFTNIQCIMHAAQLQGARLAHKFAGAISVDVTIELGGEVTGCRFCGERGCCNAAAKAPGMFASAPPRPGLTVARRARLSVGAGARAAASAAAARDAPGPR